VNAVNWTLVKAHVETLTQPTVVQGPIQYRDQAEKGRDLWNLSGRQADALEMSNGDKLRLRGYIEGLADAVAETYQRNCRFWQLKCKRDAK
jgi:hypothetical protein